MFTLNPARVVFLHRDAIDFRKNINGLASLVEHALGMNAFANAVFVFGNRRRDRIMRASSGPVRTVPWSRSRCSSCTGCSTELTCLRCVGTGLFRING